MKVTAKLSTYARLGLSNIARVASYRLGLRSGLHPVQRVRADSPEGPFFRHSERGGAVPPANAAWNDGLWWFGHYRRPMPPQPPDWFDNPFSEARQPDASRDWWQIPDFGAGDIKGLWELSRFDWVVAWATMAAHGDTIALGRLNAWLEDWAKNNPPYKGPNWKCGQEASIRVMHLITAAWTLGQDNAPERGLVDLLVAHLQRIAPTMSYAIGQQNNHGTSEAAALFVGGSFLAGHDPRAEAWMRKGRYWLEERAQALIEPDGSFSQYSVTYQRVMLDTYSLAEAWRRDRQLPEFSRRLVDRLAAATRWLYAMTDPNTGDAPNIGANDGARLLQLTGTDYRDFRPSVQLAAALFENRDAFGSGPWYWVLGWLGVDGGTSPSEPASCSFDDGGFHVLQAGSAKAILRYPRFRFRPSQADALHVDLWFKGSNLLRDAGTFSYNSDGGDWFSGTAAHNTIEFDERDQMPRLGRFLFADWIEAADVETVHQDGQSILAAAAYRDSRGARHHRHISLNAGTMICRDTISGSFGLACLRWRLAPDDWTFDGNMLRGSKMTLAIEVDGVSVKPTLSTTSESRYYQDRTSLPLVSVIVTRPGKLITTVNL